MAVRQETSQQREGSFYVTVMANWVNQITGSRFSYPKTGGQRAFQSPVRPNSDHKKKLLPGKTSQHTVAFYFKLNQSFFFFLNFLHFFI